MSPPRQAEEAKGVPIERTPYSRMFLDTDQATRLYHVCMGVIEMAESSRVEDHIPTSTLAVFKRELLNLLEVGSGFRLAGPRGLRLQSLG